MKSPAAPKLFGGSGAAPMAVTLKSGSKPNGSCAKVRNQPEPQERKYSPNARRRRPPPKAWSSFTYRPPSPSRKPSGPRCRKQIAARRWPNRRLQPRPVRKSRVHCNGLDHLEASQDQELRVGASQPWVDRAGAGLRPLRAHFQILKFTRSFLFSNSTRQSRKRKAARMTRPAMMVAMPFQENVP